MADTTEVKDEDECNGVVTVLEDEHGNQFKTVTVDEVVFPFEKLKIGAEKRLSYVKNFPYEDGDVLLCSYPKTGTHWTANLLHYLMYDGPLDDLVSHPPCLIDLFDMDTVQQREGRRIVTSHFPPKSLPIEHFEKGGKTVLVFRNPKDAAVSMYHQLIRFKMLGEFKLSWNSYIDYWVDGKMLMGSFFDYYNKWQKYLEEKPDLDVLIVQYEDLKMDSLNQLRRIQTYLGLSHSDERLQTVLDKCSLGNLRADVENGKIKTVLIDESGKSILYRKGIIGDWKNHFTVAQDKKIEVIARDKFKNSIFNYKAWVC
ncbi:sulfotransferase 2A1-like isoform X3 [Ruditapes philippinarum]|uniref:sulfotransferase 2A1-like isoform X3 n=1 Tax=Ruditapes philippinarum TaxID=129788 RepID=UPI00295A7D67|nr:sulfotransferase 2A1-like isoform X3 [Ruditapes philippinarum]